MVGKTDLAKKINACRICGNTELIPFLDFGDMALTGKFPKSAAEPVDVAPLSLVKCFGWCGLVQLADSYPAEKLYGDDYGYRSSLNRSMIEHLSFVADRCKEYADLKPGDVIIDIGSNDGTFLREFMPVYEKVGIDPTAHRFRGGYDPEVTIIPEFFSKKHVTKKAKLITSIAMFYDLERPLDFVHDVYESLEQGGIWAVEVAHWPTLMGHGIYDNVCHEHLEYYTCKQLQYMFKKAGFKVVYYNFNDTNGGSMLVLAMKINAVEVDEAWEALGAIPDHDSMEPYYKFRNQVYQHKDALNEILKDKIVAGYGASTKGNVLLQFCELGQKIPFILEVNKDKFGHVTPGTNIPIVSSAMIKDYPPDYFLVLPWHFKKTILEKEDFEGGFIFPFPEIHIEIKVKTARSQR